MNIYVGNLAWGVSDEDLQKAFEEFGKVDSASVIKDKYTSRSRGFAFVEMSNDEEGKKAIEAINGKDIKGRQVKVNEARPRTDRNDR